jgi:small GTP-binding protein
MSSQVSPLNVVILGLENAGKTTLLQTIAGNDFSEQKTTIGLNIELLDYEGLTIQAIDLGGQRIFRETLWGHYATLAQGVIFIFDIFNAEKLKEAKLWFEYIQSWISEDAKLIFLANKIDLKEINEDYLALDDIIHKFQLEKLSAYPKRSFRIFEVSAKTGKNVKESITWFFGKLVENLRTQRDISYILVLDSENNMIYFYDSDEQELGDIPEVISDTINKMKEIGVKQNMVKTDEETFNVVVDKNFSVVLGSRNDLSSNDLLIASTSISTLIKNEYFPPAEFKHEIGNLINVALVQNKNTRNVKQ